MDHKLLQLKAFKRSQTFSMMDEAAWILRESTVERDIYQEVVKLVDWLLCVPVASAEAERSFSKLRHVKTWLRSTMSERRLSDLMVCHVHQQKLNEVDISRAMKAFVVTDDSRRRVVGGIH